MFKSSVVVAHLVHCQVNANLCCAAITFDPSLSGSPACFGCLDTRPPGTDLVQVDTESNTALSYTLSKDCKHVRTCSGFNLAFSFSRSPNKASSDFSGVCRSYLPRLQPHHFWKILKMENPWNHQLPLVFYTKHCKLHSIHVSYLYLSRLLKKDFCKRTCLKKKNVVFALDLSGAAGCL